MGNALNLSFFLVESVGLVRGSSLSSMADGTSPSPIFKSEESIHCNNDGDDLSPRLRTKTEILSRPPSSNSHHRSNTVPARGQPNDQLNTHLSPVQRRKTSHKPTKTESFSPSLLQVPPRRRIRIIDDDDTDECESQTSSVISPDR